MIYLEKILIVIMMMVLFFGLFKIASGSLSLKKLNTNSLAFYFLFLYCFIGANAVFLGFRNHYLIQKCSEEVLNKSYWIIMYALIMLPVGIILFERLINIKHFHIFFSRYCERKIVLNDAESVFTIICVLTIIGFAALAYTFICIGYIPLLELFKGNFYLMNDRINIGRGFKGNEYIRNIFALLLIPSLSYVAYIYYKLTKQPKWKLLFCILFILSILCKTYNFEKSPVILYVAYFYIIEVMMDNVHRLGKAVKYAIAGCGVLLIMYYVVIDYTGAFFTLSSGPMGRIFITQIATCYLHVQAFPSRHAFLNGASFPRLVAWLFNSSEYGVRSGRTVMEIYNAAGATNGTAGTMNSLYIAEAYANFGTTGVIIAPFVVSFFITVIPCFILKQEKTPLHMALYVIVTSIYTNCLVGGYIDFIYNISIIFIIVLFLIMEAVVNKGKIKIRK